MSFLCSEHFLKVEDLRSTKNSGLKPTGHTIKLLAISIKLNVPLILHLRYTIPG
nr:9720_t:CDS:2 [Entrophospora candida]